MKVSLATAALYLRVGLQTRILHPVQASDWATGVVVRMDDALPVIVDISWQSSRAQLIEDLNNVPGDADAEMACSALLGMLRDRMQSSGADLHATLIDALMVTTSFDMSDRVDTFSGIEARLQLALSGTAGSVEECRQAFDNAMKEYACAPLAL